MNKFKLTIITVVKNDEKNIEKTIKSVINQKDVKFEYIIIFPGDITLNIHIVVIFGLHSYRDFNNFDTFDFFM